jgi:hypothetical protein
MKWPFVTKRVVPGTTGMFMMVNDTSTPSQLSKIAGIVLFVIIVSVLLTLVYWGMLMTFKRYELAADAIKQGKPGIAALALAPEVGAGVNALWH